MPSDDPTAGALAALEGSQGPFRATLAATLESVRRLLDETRAASADRVDRLSAEFGALAGIYLDVERLAATVMPETAVDPSIGAVVERGQQALQEIAARPVSVAAVPAGGSLAATVGDTLAEIGRAMGAARVVALARQGRYRPAEHDPYLKSFPFGQWSQAERSLAPPLVVTVAGVDLRPAALAEFLDGRTKIVLVVSAPATPAPLVRLVTPGVFVAQAVDGDVLARLAAWEGPGIVALMPAGAAEFVHEPSTGGTPARLTVTTQPTAAGLRRVGPFTAAQQRDELQQLDGLAAAFAAASLSATLPAPTADDPAGRLAAWLLTQAEQPAQRRIADG